MLLIITRKMLLISHVVVMGYAITRRRRRGAIYFSLAVQSMSPYSCKSEIQNPLRRLMFATLQSLTAERSV
ncbi:hypothetical protein F5Y17DRAFT_410959 [Xylariaceae sp. FL0594]|nr:hypothetical protein F5Y17DRAFT_410959 [Xylariaceae sp. FL0594]